MKTIDNINRIVVSDALKFLCGMADSSIPLFFFSPPYNLGRRAAGSSGMPGRGDRNGNRNGKWSGGALADGYDDDDDNRPWPEYISWQKAILSECWRCIPDTGAVFYNHKERILNGVLLDPISFVPTCCILRQRIIWARSGGTNFSSSFFCPTHEVILLLAKPGFRLKSKGASGVGSVWRVPQEKNTWHPAPFPLALADRVIETTMPNLICDPFSGSGTVGRAAKRAGIDFTGCDRNATYVERANMEIAQEHRLTIRQMAIDTIVEQQLELL